MMISVMDGVFGEVSGAMGAHDRHASHVQGQSWCENGVAGEERSWQREASGAPCLSPRRISSASGGGGCE